MKPEPTKSANRFFLYVMGGIVGLFVIILSIAYFVKREKPAAAPIAAPVSQTATAEAQPTPQPTAEAKAPSSDETDPYAGVTEAEPDPAFVKQHVAKLLQVINGQLKGARLTLQQNTDPTQTAEINRRIEMVEKFKTKLEAVDPKNKATWFFMNEKDALNNNFLPMEEAKKK